MIPDGLNALGRRILTAVLQQHPGWEEYAHVTKGGDLELTVPAPAGSRAKFLVILTARGEDVWIRFAPPRAFYNVGSDQEMHAVVNALLRDDAFFVVVTNGDEWIETAILRPGEEPVLAEGHTANVVSWSGLHDRIVTFTARRPTKGS